MNKKLLYGGIAGGIATVSLAALVYTTHLNRNSAGYLVKKVEKCIEEKPEDYFRVEQLDLQTNLPDNVERRHIYVYFKDGIKPKVALDFLERLGYKVNTYGDKPNYNDTSFKISQYSLSNELTIVVPKEKQETRDQFVNFAVRLVAETKCSGAIPTILFPHPVE